MGEAMEAAVDDVGAFCAAHGIDAWYTKAGSLSVSAAPAQDGSWDEAVRALRGHGLGDRYVAGVRGGGRRTRPLPGVPRWGIHAGRRDGPAGDLARGLRRVLLERGVVIAEGTEAVEIDGVRPGPLAASGLGARRAPSRRGNGRGLRPVRVRTRRPGDGEVLAGSAVVAINAWAAGWPWFAQRLVTWSSYIVLTAPIPDRLADIGWTGGEGVADARFTLHYLRTTPDGRIAIGGGGGRAGFGGAIGDVFTDDARAAGRAAAGLRRLFPSIADVPIEDAWGGPIDISADHLPWVGPSMAARSTTGFGYSGNGVGPSLVVGRILAAMATERATTRPLPFPWRTAVLLGDSRPNRLVTSVLVWCARPPLAASRWRSVARTPVCSCGSSADSRDGSATTSGPTEPPVPLARDGP